MCKECPFNVEKKARHRKYGDRTCATNKEEK